MHRHLWICGTADWFSLEILTQGACIRPPGTTVVTRVEDGPGISRFTITDTSLLVCRHPCGSGPVDIDLFVDIPESVDWILLMLGHGDNGRIRVRSDGATVTNDKPSDHDCNERPYFLALTPAGREPAEKARQEYLQKERAEAARRAKKGRVPAGMLGDNDEDGNPAEA